MGLTWTIGGVDKSSVVRLDDWILSECAMRGQVGTGGIRIDDTAGTYTPPGQKVVSVVESAASPTRMFTGYVAERGAVQGPMAPGQRQWDVTFEDANVFLDDLLIGSTGNRASETDVARILWLIASTAMTGVTTGHIPNTNTVTMDAIDYRGKHPREVLEDCAQKAGKNFFIYNHGGGDLLFYDLSTGTNLSSTVQISDVASEVDSVTVLGPRGVNRRLDPSRVYSGVRLRYKSSSVTVDNATTEATYRKRQVFKTYKRIKTAARATEQANKWLDQASEETETLSLEVDVAAADVNDIRAGQRIQVKLTRHGISAFTWYRIVRRDVMPCQGSDVRYTLRLEFADKIRPTRFAGGGGDDQTDEEMSNSTEDDASVVIDSGGITVTGGSISVTNSSGVVIIDGSTDFLSIVDTGWFNIPLQRRRGSAFISNRITTGLTGDPITFWTARIPGTDGKGDWSLTLPALYVSDSGVVVRMVQGRARYEVGPFGADGTRVMGQKFTSNPPADAQRVRWYIMQKDQL